VPPHRTSTHQATRFLQRFDIICDLRLILSYIQVFRVDHEHDEREGLLKAPQLLVELREVHRGI
jgi:hypothetical protein